MRDTKQFRDDYPAGEALREKLYPYLDVPLALAYLVVVLFIVVLLS